MTRVQPPAIVEPTQTDARVDKPIFRGLRALVAAVPVVGGSISLLIEAELSARQSARVSHLFERISEIENDLRAAQQGGTVYSEVLLEHAALRVRSSPETFRARVLANCLFIDYEEDAHEIVRHHLIELAVNLTTLELAILLGTSSEIGFEGSSSLREHLHQIDLGDPMTEDLRGYSRQRLEGFGLISSAEPSGKLTRIGEKLSKALC